MPDAQRVSAKYVFLDVVNYSTGRSVEAQTDIISTLNDLVRVSLMGFILIEEQRVYLPTGDGICIGLLGVESPYDVHIQLALEILRRLHAYNQDTADEMRRFQIRIGVNANVDNLVTDINGKRNVSGAGINLAQRVMNAGDGNQILVGEAVFETLRYREKYMHTFKSFTATAKHGIRLRIHQLIQSSPGLDVSVPTEFKQIETAEPRLPQLTAYYFAHAILNREFLKSTLRTHGFGQGTFTCMVLLYMLASDSVRSSSASDIKPQNPHAWNAGKASLNEQFDYYESLNFWLISELAEFVEAQYLSEFSSYFESSGWPKDRHFITQKGREKLRTEWPMIWAEFGFKTTS